MSALVRLVRCGGNLRALALATLLSAATFGCAIGLMACAAWLLSRAAEHPDPSRLAVAAVAVRALGLGRGLFRYAERLVGHDATLAAVATVRVEVFRGLVAQDVAAPTGGDSLARVVHDVEALQDLWLRCLLPWVSALVVSAGCVLACWVWLPAAGLVLLAGLGVALVVVPAAAAVLARRRQAVAAARARHVERVLDVVHGCAELTAYGQLAAALRRASDAAAQLARLDRQGARAAAVVQGLSVGVQGVTVLGVAALGVAAVRAGTLPPVLLAVVVLVALSAFESVAGLSEAGGLLPEVHGAAVRLAPLVGVPERPAVVLGVTGPPALRKVGFRYDGCDEPVLVDVDLVLRPGEAVAVVGGSGAGKTTLLKLLSGQLTPTVGSAQLGGRELASLLPEERARHVVVAEQEAHLFDATVRDNLLLARPDASDAQLRDAIDVAGLSEWVAGLPLGLRTRVGERGGRVSGGERKRLAVARALLSTAPVVLLDEPTEGLDHEAADALLGRLVRSCRERALVVVTHRVQALDQFDAVVSVDHGRLRDGRALLAVGT